MSDSTKRILKIIGAGVLWVFILSIRVQGRTIFSYANDILVQNRIVTAIDQILGEGYDSVVTKISSTYDALTGQEKKF